MAFLRVAVLLAALASVLLAGGYLLTKDRRYIRASLQVMKYTAIGAFVFFGVLFAEELWFSDRR